jgi:4-hydroxyphenylacetate 3-monooxygenase/anthranilate 3-monooxygenase (FAD)/4-hydroxyphenylacetate 3-monooxygenase
MGARTGQQFLDGLRKTSRQLWLRDERVGDVTSHPALAGAAGTLAEVFDRQYRFSDECLIPDPQTGEPINISHMLPRSVDDLRFYLTSAASNRINAHLSDVDRTRAYALVESMLPGPR